jgi:hypothetical protein
LGNILSDWQHFVPATVLAALAIAAIVVWLRRKPADSGELERQRRAYLNRIGRIVEGQVLEIVDRGHAPASANPGSEPDGHPAGLFSRGHQAGPAGPSQTLLYYAYSISGVSYETAQDITGLEERLHLTRVAAGQIASVKYDPSNPSNSILLADDWSGLQ